MRWNMIIKGGLVSVQGAMERELGGADSHRVNSECELGYRQNVLFLGDERFQVAEIEEAPNR